MAYQMSQRICLRKDSKTIHYSQNNQFLVLISVTIIAIRIIFLYVALRDFKYSIYFRDLT